MDIVFGLWADGGAHPEHGGGPGGSMGKPVVGPAGFAEILETLLGTTAPPTLQVARIASFQAALESLTGTFFWSKSLNMDPWSTSRTLLGWRDELIGLGWNPTQSWHQPRLRDLATIANAATHLRPGLSDRLSALLENLEHCSSLPLKRIRLIDPMDLLPSPIRRLITRLEQLGCSVENIEVAAAAPTETSLGKLQRWMLGETIPMATIDETVTIATSTSTPLAAELVGQWFADLQAADIALIAQDGDTDLLDHGLRLSAQPLAGRSRASIHRGSLQLLLLAFKCTWAPFDPNALMGFLIFPNSPIPERVAKHLASALEEAPGRGGPLWTEAWANIAEQEHGLERADQDRFESIEAQISGWREWTDLELADPLVGIPLTQALQICDRVSTWASRRFATTESLLFSATATLATEVKTALKALGRELIPRLLIERVIDQALGVGHPNPNCEPEAASWCCVPQPGAVWAPVDTVVWWNFRSTNEGTLQSPWTNLERDELAAAGCPADEITLIAQSASAAWERAILNARKSLLFVSAGLDCDADNNLHPLAHRLKPALDKVGKWSRLEDALSLQAYSVANATIKREAVEHKPLPAKHASWTTPANFSSRLQEVTESATSLENLFSCQLMWALRHVAHLRPGRTRVIPDINRILGNLAHAIAREIFLPGDPPTPDEASKSALAVLDDHIDQIAAPLRHPEFAIELNVARQRLPAAMASLASCLSENSLTVEATEQQVSETFESLLALRGAVDLIARDQQGNAVIIDLKWTRSERKRIDELSEGKAVQLACYGSLVSGEQPYRAGYFLLNQRQFATLENSGLLGRQVRGSRTFSETWAALLNDWSIWRASAEAGQVLATGIEGVSDFLPKGIALEREVRCDWCDYATLCRTKGEA